MFFCFFSFLFWDVIFALFKAHSGYPHLVSAWCKCFSSCCNSSGLEQMVLALWWRVPTTPYLDVIVWLLSHFRYWSVWVSFLYTVVFNVPSSLGVMRMSRKGMEPSDLDSSLVNCMCWSIELRCCRNSSVLDDFRMVRVSSTNLLQKDGGFWAVCMALVSRSSIYRLATNGLMGDPMAVPSFCS